MNQIRRSPESGNSAGHPCCALAPGSAPGVCAGCGATGSDVRDCVDAWTFIDDQPWVEPRCTPCFELLLLRDSRSEIKSYRL